jgi:hypothetical protein
MLPLVSFDAPPGKRADRLAHAAEVRAFVKEIVDGLRRD